MMVKKRINCRAKGICKVNLCNKKSICKGFCKAHYMRYWRYGDAEEPRRIGKKGYGFISDYGYKKIGKNRKVLYVHRLIMEEYLNRKLFSYEHIHHINGDKLDNRIENLQIISIEEHGSISGKKSKGCPKLNARKDYGFRKCPYCNKKFELNSKLPNKIYCSHNCYGKSKKGKKLTEEHKNNISNALRRHYG